MKTHVLPEVVVFAPGRMSRHEAAFSWVLEDALGLRWRWEDDRETYAAETGEIRCHYGTGDAALPGVSFFAEGLLSEMGALRSSPPSTEGHQVDWFAAVFWMGSRMEEFLAEATRDEHGRFDPVGSPSFDRGWLEKPICEEWAFRVGEMLLGDAWADHEQRLKAEFQVRPTVDIDSAFAYRGKGVWRTGGAAVRDLLQGQWGRCWSRMNASLLGGMDPYDTYSEAHDVHRRHELNSTWFFLLSRFGSHDKGLPPTSGALQKLMLGIKENEPAAEVAWHPGYAAATQPDVLQAEWDQFVRITGEPPQSARHHYLKMEPSASRRRLIALGIQRDHTEGHASRVGFRGGFSRPRKWYDLERETLTELEIHPFAAMDATFLRYMCMEAGDVPQHVARLARNVQAVGGTMRLLWHNESMAPVGQWKDWGGVYEACLIAAITGEAPSVVKNK